MGSKESSQFITLEKNNYMKISKEEIISIAQTFVSAFILNIGAALTLIPVEQIMSGEFFTSAVIISLVLGAGRSALKQVWQKVMPVSFGGKK